MPIVLSPKKCIFALQFCKNIYDKLKRMISKETLIKRNSRKRSDVCSLLDSLCSLSFLDMDIKVCGDNGLSSLCYIVKVDCYTSEIAAHLYTLLISLAIPCSLDGGRFITISFV